MMNDVTVERLDNAEEVVNLHVALLMATTPMFFLKHFCSVFLCLHLDCVSGHPQVSVADPSH